MHFCGVFFDFCRYGGGGLNGKISTFSSSPTKMEPPYQKSDKSIKNVARADRNWDLGTSAPNLSLHPPFISNIIGIKS